MDYVGSVFIKVWCLVAAGAICDTIDQIGDSAKQTGNAKRKMGGAQSQSQTGAFSSFLNKPYDKNSYDMFITKLKRSTNIKLVIFEYIEILSIHIQVYESCTYHIDHKEEMRHKIMLLLVMFNELFRCYEVCAIQKQLRSFVNHDYGSLDVYINGNIRRIKTPQLIPPLQVIINKILQTATKPTEILLDHGIYIYIYGLNKVSHM